MKALFLALISLAVSIAASGASRSRDPGPSVAHARQDAVHEPSGTALQSFGDQASFDAVVGDPAALASEDFNSAHVGAFAAALCDEPVDSASNDACFAPGDLAGGFHITSTSIGSGIVALGSNRMGARQQTPAIGAFSVPDATIVTFDAPVEAVSADYYVGTGIFGGNVGSVSVEAFDASGASLGIATTPTVARGTPVFLGLVSATPIARIEVQASVGEEVLDNLRFGNVAQTTDRIFADGFGGATRPPIVKMSFDPAAINTVTSGLLTITLTNVNATPAALLDDLVDAFPPGLVTATPAIAATTCAGVAGATDGGGFVMLARGAEIPAAASCTVTAFVTAAKAATYTNSIPAGALRTDVGDNASEATADIVVLDAASCNPVQLLKDPGFELTDTSGGFPFSNPAWTSTSTNLGTSFCDFATCGNGFGTAGPRAGTFWVWMGGVPGPVAETSTVSQDVVIPAGQTRFLNFWLWIGFVGSAGDGASNLDISVDGIRVASFPEPSANETGYTQRSVDISRFADGGTHTITFTYTDPSRGGSNDSLDDVTMDCLPASTAPTTPRPAYGAHAHAN